MGSRWEATFANHKNCIVRVHCDLKIIKLLTDNIKLKHNIIFKIKNVQCSFPMGTFGMCDFDMWEGVKTTSIIIPIKSSVR